MNREPGVPSHSARMYHPNAHTGVYQAPVIPLFPVRTPERVYKTQDDSYENGGICTRHSGMDVDPSRAGRIIPVLGEQDRAEAMTLL
jgi:hypothetical protein